MNAIEIKSAQATSRRIPKLQISNDEPSWLANARQNAIAHFERMGLPTPRDEDWRFTNVAPLAQFELESKPRPHGVTGAVLEKAPDFPGDKLVFINGVFAPDLSSVQTTSASGGKATNVLSALKNEAAIVQKHLFPHADSSHNAFAALNAGYFQDGAFIYVAADRVISEPIHLVFVSTVADGETTHPRNLIVAERGSRVTVLETYVSLGETAHFTNSVTKIFAEENASVEHLKLQTENPNAFHIATITARCGRNSNLIAHSFALGARLSRTNIYANLAGEAVESLFNGLYLTRGSQLADHFMIVDHAAPHCASHEYFNGILDGQSKGVFHGRIHVRPGAQKTDAKQTNKNLLLSNSATVDSKPQLEIYADDVKCTHGATVGQLDEKAIFYLRARGISAEKARRMLVHAFAGEIVGRIRCASVREQLDRWIWRQLEDDQAIIMESK